MQKFSLFSDIREAAKQFQSVDICCGKKVHKYVGMWANPLCNRLSNWCRKLPKMMHLDASPELLIFVKNIQNAWIHSLNWFTSYSHSTFSVFDECVLRIWPGKNAARVYSATPKFWHKIRDSEKSVEYLLNRPRLPPTKSFLQLWDVLKLVYTHSWP